jgi:hypothetical protein
VRYPISDKSSRKLNTQKGAAGEKKKSGCGGSLNIFSVGRKTKRTKS